MQRRRRAWRGVIGLRRYAWAGCVALVWGAIVTSTLAAPASYREAAEVYYRSSEPKLLYNWIAKARFELYGGLRRTVLEPVSYLLLRMPSLAVHAVGGPAGVAQAIGWDAAKAAVEEYFDDPRAAAEKQADAAFSIGMAAYRENYALYEARAAGHVFTEEEAVRLVVNAYLQGYVGVAKNLDDEIRASRVPTSPEIQARNTAAKRAALAAVEDWLGAVAKTKAGQVIKGWEFREVVDNAQGRSKAGLFAYPPYERFRAAIDGIEARLASKRREIEGGRAASAIDLSPMRDGVLSSLDIPVGPARTADAIDLVFVIDTTASMRDDIDAVKQSATRIIDQIHAVSSSPRLAIVAYRDYTCEYLTRAWPFTADRDEVRRNIMALTLEPKGNPDVPEAVYEGLLDAIRTREIGQWRDGVKKVVILMGDAPPHSKKHTENEVVKAAEEVDPAHIFPIAVAGADAPTMAAFSALAHRTGGAMSTTAAAADLPAEIMRIVALGSRLADEKVFAGRVTEVTGDSVGIELSEPAPVQPGMLVLVFAADTPGLLVGEGPVVLGGGARYTVEMRAMYGTRVPRPGGPVRVLTKR